MYRAIARKIKQKIAYKLNKINFYFNFINNFA